MANDSALSSGMAVLGGLHDVENYIWKNDGEGSLPSDRYRHLLELMQRGNNAFRGDHFEEAISYYSRANSIKPGDPVILGNRAAAFCRISQYLKQRSASDSEYRPLNGLDPTMHAELALKDAEKVMSLRNNSVDPYILKANALILLEKYDLAHDAIISGLQVDPFSNILQESLKNLETTKYSLMRRSVSKEACGDDFDCTLCLKLLYEPITTPCGHSFCRLCLLQSMDRSNKCPLCRTVLFISTRTCGISVTLKNIIQKSFPEEYAERKSEHDSLTDLEVDLLPLFVMDVMIPCQKSSLHIFEPRYRLMVRRIMEGNHRMGMVIPDSIGSIADFGCEVEITECEPLPDGRFYLEIESRRRFCIRNSWDQDGYRVAKVEWIQDDSPELPEEKEELQELANNAAEYARAWLTRVRESAGRDRRRLERLLNVESMMPTIQDPERFSFWLTTLTDRRPEERLELLTIRDTKERLRRGLVYLKAREQGCRLQ